MAQSESRGYDPWALPTLMLWGSFMVIGFWPDLFFEVFREMGLVVSQGALVNSPFAITLAFSIYFGYFVFRLGRESGVTRDDASAKAVQCGLIGFVAFLPFPVEMLLQTGEILSRELRMVVYIFVPLKSLCWFYLISIPVRYYAFGNTRVVGDLWCVFPSAGGNAEDSGGDARESEEPAADETPESDPEVVSLESYKYKDASKG